MTIGERVLMLIRGKGMTQREFSERTGIPQSTISDWKGKRLNPGSDKILTICEVLDTNPYELIYGTDSFDGIKQNYLIIYKDSEEYQLLVQYRNLNSEGKKRLMHYTEILKD